MCISYICHMIPQKAVHTNTKIKLKKDYGEKSSHSEFEV